MRCVLVFRFNPRLSTNIQGTRRAWRWLSVTSFSILATHCLLGANASSASLAGSVVDDSGHPVVGARVLISHAPSIKPPVAAPPVITGSLAAMVTADANGAFHADGLAPDQYIACAETTAPGLLDPCHWSTSAPSFTVSAGQIVSGMKIVMKRGAVLRIHIDDPQQLLKFVTGPVDFDLEIHVVTGKGLHYSAPVQSSTATGRDHAITIPFDTSLSLRVLSAHLTVNDQSGKPFAALGAAVNVPAGAVPAVMGLTVTGKK
jgi:hypothetical protein